jgi:hypothetical protein
MLPKRALVGLESTLDSLYNNSTASHYETDTDKRPYRTSKPHLKGAKLRPAKVPVPSTPLPDPQSPFHH